MRHGLLEDTRRSAWTTPVGEGCRTGPDHYPRRTGPDIETTGGVPRDPQDRRTIGSFRDPASRNACDTEVAAPPWALDRPAALRHLGAGHPPGRHAAARGPTLRAPRPRTRPTGHSRPGPGGDHLNYLFRSVALPIRSRCTRSSRPSRPRRARQIRRQVETFARLGDPYGTGTRTPVANVAEHPDGVKAGACFTSELPREAEPDRTRHPRVHTDGHAHTRHPTHTTLS